MVLRLYQKLLLMSSREKLIKPLPIEDYQCHRSIRLYIYTIAIISNFLKYQGINNPKYTGT